ncbi:MAG TPA: hypothetical protein V6D13_12080 [Halomicronema sp.]
MINYQIPKKRQEFVALRDQAVSEELVAAAIVGVVMVARQEGRSLEELKAEVLADDQLLDKGKRRWLSEVVSDAWQRLESDKGGF